MIKIYEKLSTESVTKLTCRNNWTVIQTFVDYNTSIFLQECKHWNSIGRWTSNSITAMCT